MSESTFIMALAGLLHDMGKFALRAGEGGTRTWDDQGVADFGYKHALLTADFIDRYVPEPWRVPVKNAAGSHHRPAARGDWIIALADRLSAGERAGIGLGDKMAQPRQLLSVFCSVEADGQRAPAEQFWPLEALRLDEGVVFPRAALSDEGSRQRYGELWAAFTAEAAKLAAVHATAGDLPTYVEHLLLMMQRFLWCVPSAYYGSKPDISLYDHSRMTAALAAVLERRDLGDAELQALGRQADKSDEGLALLVGGDLSGVQDFIYTIAARRAASALRGRSFYLQLLTEAVTRFLLDRLELPITNVVYAGGGKFYLLARPEDQTRLPAAQREISGVLLAQHRGELYLALAWQPLHGRDFYEGGISRAWGALRRRHAGGQAAAFQRAGWGHRRPLRAARPRRQRGIAVPGLWRRTSRHPDPKPGSGQRSGARLPAVCLIRGAWAVPAPGRASGADQDHRGARAGAAPGTWEETLAALGCRAALFGPGAALPGLDGLRRVVLALSDEALAALSGAAGARTAVGRRFLVNVTPVATAADVRTLRERRLDEAEMPWPGDVMPFGALEALSRGIPRLGVLRMDVDNLGRLFAEGMGDRATLSRVAGLSSAVSFFFEGWVGVLAERRNRDDAREGLGRRLYSIYSGGDDLFFVGAWDAVAELAREVRVDLARYAARHPGIHASAGLVLVGGKYPLSQAAADAAEAEAAAKGLHWVKDKARRSKDAICFLGQALPWERFGLEPCASAGVGSAHALMHRLVGMGGEPDQGGPGAPRALIRRLIQLHEQYQATTELRRREGREQNVAGEEQVLWGPWMWQAVYTLTRMANRTKDADINVLRDQLRKDEFRSMPWIGLAARWAELYLR